MTQNQKDESKAELVNVLCKTCGKVTPHIIEERKAGCGGVTRIGREEVPKERVEHTSRVGICVFCKTVRILSLTTEVD